MKNVMKNAWVIAKQGQVKFGGSVREYFASALKMAWAAAKTPKKVLIELTVNNRKGKTWVVRITGTHPQYKLNREFVSSAYDEDGECGYRLLDGLYEICEVGNRRYIQVANNSYTVLKEIDVLELVA